MSKGKTVKILATKGYDKLAKPLRSKGRTKTWEIWVSCKFRMRSERNWGPTKAEIKEAIESMLEHKTIMARNFQFEQAEEIA